MAKKDDSVDERYEELFALDHFGMFAECGVDGETITSLLVIAKRMATDMDDKELDREEQDREVSHLGNQIRANEVMHELNMERFHSAESILHQLRMPAQFKRPELRTV